MKKILFDGILICARQKKQSSKYISVAACVVTLPAFLPWFSKLKDKVRNRKGTKKIKKLIISIWNFLYFLLEKKWWKKQNCYPQVSASAHERAESKLDSSDSAHARAHVFSLRSCMTWAEQKQWNFYKQHLHTIFFPTTFSLFIQAYFLLFLVCPIGISKA